MGTFAAFLGYALGLLPSIVTTIESVQGDRIAGANKKQMALDALQGALQGASAVFVPGSTNAILSQAAGSVAAQGITAAGAIAAIFSHVQKHDAVTSAVNLTRATGAYQAATAEAQAAQQAALQGPQGASTPVVA